MIAFFLKVSFNDFFKDFKDDFKVNLVDDLINELTSDLGANLVVAFLAIIVDNFSLGLS
jgi:hypothetical protein